MRWSLVAGASSAVAIGATAVTATASASIATAISPRSRACFLILITPPPRDGGSVVREVDPHHRSSAQDRRYHLVRMDKNELRLRDLAAASLLDRSRLLAGRAGLDRPVARVVVRDIGPGTRPPVRDGDLVVARRAG